jgi:predicted dinucleotide-binding enzyme
LAARSALAGPRPDAGPLTQARLIEPFALLWISMALKYGYGRDIAFKLLPR